MSLLLDSCWDFRANNQSTIPSFSRQNDEPSLFMKKKKQNPPKKHIWFRDKSIGLCYLIYFISSIATVIFWNNDFKRWSFTFSSLFLVLLLSLSLISLPPPALLRILLFGHGLNLRNSETDGSQGNLFMIVAESFSMRFCWRLHRLVRQWSRC